MYNQFVKKRINTYEIETIFMTILLDSFTFSPLSDVVEENDLILIPDGSFVYTLAGNDLISSVYTIDLFPISDSHGDTMLDLPEGIFGVYNQGSLDTSFGKDTILGNVEYTGESLVRIVSGITQSFDGANNDFTSAIISTGRGDDKVLGGRI